MSVSNFGGNRPDSAQTLASYKRVDSAEGSFLSASADVLNDSQDGSNDEEDHNDRAFAQVYHEYVKTHATSEEDKERYQGAQVNASCIGSQSYDFDLLDQNKRSEVK